jgi:hypothetical protein
MFHPQVGDTADGFQIWKVGANMLNKKFHAVDGMVY